MKIIQLIKSFVILFSISFYLLASETITGKVISVLDGDTVIILDNHKNQHKIRLAGIDAPEKNQDFGAKAKQLLSSKIFGKQIEVKVQTIDRGRRSVGDIYFNSNWINLEMVQEGYAWRYKRYSNDRKLSMAQEQARESKLGLWQQKYPTPPWEFRHGGKYENGFIRITPEMHKELVKEADELARVEGKYWLNMNTGVRHNSSCKNFGKRRKGKYCLKFDGKPCGICGG